jgi:hypothetical protein
MVIIFAAAFHGAMRDNSLVSHAMPGQLLDRLAKLPDGRVRKSQPTAWHMNRITQIC